MLMDAIHIRDLRLWAHVGVLDQERRDGQWFNVEISLHLDLSQAAADDDLSASADYSLAIRDLQTLARRIRCLTIEHFSEQILDRLEALYGPVPMTLILSKCAAPVPGFSGVVSVQRCRHGAPAPESASVTR